MKLRYILRAYVSQKHAATCRCSSCGQTHKFHRECVAIHEFALKRHVGGTTNGTKPGGGGGGYTM